MFSRGFTYDPSRGCLLFILFGPSTGVEITKTLWNLYSLRQSVIHSSSPLFAILTNRITTGPHKQTAAEMKSKKLASHWVVLDREGRE